MLTFAHCKGREIEKKGLFLNIRLFHNWYYFYSWHCYISMCSSPVNIISIQKQQPSPCASVPNSTKTKQIPKLKIIVGEMYISTKCVYCGSTNFSLFWQFLFGVSALDHQHTSSVLLNLSFPFQTKFFSRILKRHSSAAWNSVSELYPGDCSGIILSTGLQLLLSCATHV